jgi:hypothetical protein
MGDWRGLVCASTAQQAFRADAADKARIQTRIDATDRQIDRLVYDLYDLTPDEIAIVEGSASWSPPTYGACKEHTTAPNGNLDHQHCV